jgi:hypothetical protein
MQTLNDSQLHQLARKRVEFRSHLVVYIIVNAALWLIWFTTIQGYAWPVWPMAGWGIGVLFHYLFDYRPSKFFSEDDEYLRLKKKMEKNTL